MALCLVARFDFVESYGHNQIHPRQIGEEGSQVLIILLYQFDSTFMFCEILGVPADRGGSAIEDLVVPRVVAPPRTSAIGYEQWTEGLDSVGYSVKIGL